MSRLEEHIDIDAPAQRVWDLLHDVDSYPTFIDGVQQARGSGGNRARLDVRAGSVRREFEAVLDDRAGDQVITWQTEGSPELKGTLSVRSVDRDHSQVQVRLEYEPGAVHDAFGGPKGMAQVHRIENTVRGDLQQFKSLAEG
ncbi:SRPBCC family protein [Streptomyces cyanogenus]|uniref:Polyketide cyclase / dehydrase and lipid transport n=1 Tax=Streptomyces cyanogenus TaxID=80860 RepID=A0ABX7TT50_STRCY|nr:SRPBCC family protein [Streptomyces cyanogenus]QTD99776.1 Polyketide cyclase / dehydrase and lipid transport [Streptomyces cyanogenus]